MEYVFSSRISLQPQFHLFTLPTFYFLHSAYSIDSSSHGRPRRLILDFTRLDSSEIFRTLVPRHFIPGLTPPQTRKPEWSRSKAKPTLKFSRPEVLSRFDTSTPGSIPQMVSVGKRCSWRNPDSATRWLLSPVVKHIHDSPGVLHHGI